MPQYNFEKITNATDGADFGPMYNAFVEAFKTMQSGTERPPNAAAGTLWLYIGSTNYIVYFYDGAQDIALFVIDTQNNLVRFVLDADRDSYFEALGVDGQIGFTAEGTRSLVFSGTGIGIGSNAPSASLHCQGTDAIIIPVGTTAQRPANPVRGMFRFNTTISDFETYDGSTWVQLHPPILNRATYQYIISNEDEPVVREIPFTNIPSWVTKIELMFDNLDSAGTKKVLIGDSGGYENNNYSGGGESNKSTDGFVLDDAIGIATGVMVLRNITGNKWVSDVNIYNESGTNYRSRQYSGFKELSAKLDRIKIVTPSPNRLYGGANILYQ